MSGFDSSDKISDVISTLEYEVHSAKGNWVTHGKPGLNNLRVSERLAADEERLHQLRVMARREPSARRRVAQTPAIRKDVLPRHWRLPAHS